MLKKRIIPCLDIKNGRTVKGINFKGLRDAGDPIALAQKYEEEGADELVFLDISATEERRATLLPLVQEIAHHLSIPFTVGGGIQSVRDVSNLLQAGADKVSLNSAAVNNPKLIQELSMAFGRQCIVLAIDSKEIFGKDTVFIHGGKKPTELETLDWARRGIDLGAGELLLTSMDFDGTKKGFDLRLLQKISKALPVPIIASGGAGNTTHFSEVFTKTNVTGALAASIFHFGEIAIPALKQELQQQKIPVRWI
ncbi:MAG: imidazole glycerol phosphate synthase subunit HisF [Alteromonas sp.]|nr:imidazole glycerol phosphate synthase subunit HisF [Alteromonas sp.]MAY22672.1 imidazole glycerol phosphate synthase subunit HisF [Flavobacteriaceae bacterium]|tara:strand:- start:48234 stop:48992 length:759 start_codon:yes stop_codon:yes gene_type:complete